MSAPPVSVVVPAYNLARFLPAALDSALGQDWPADALEVVVVDDGSTDDTPAVLEAYAGRVTVIRQPNGGLVHAVDRGLAAARGTYIALLDADDEWPADRLRRHVAHLEAHPAVGLVHGDLEVVDERGAVLHPSYFARERVAPRRGRVLGALLAGNFVTQSAITFRASLLPAVHPLPAEAAYADWWLAAAVAAVAEVDHVAGVAARYRQHGANMNLGAGAAGMDRVLTREIPWRRWMLAHLVEDDTVAFADLAPAWRAWEYGLLRAGASAAAGVRNLVAVDDDDRARGAVLATAGSSARRAGDADGAARLLLRALAADPWDGAARLELELALRASPAPRPLPGPAPCCLPVRGAVTLAWARDVVADPALLRAYGSRVGGADDATLVILTAAEDALGPLVEAVETAGLGGPGAADLLAVTAPATPPASRLLAARAGWVLTGGAPEPFAALPQHPAGALAVT